MAEKRKDKAKKRVVNVEAIGLALAAKEPANTGPKNPKIPGIILGNSCRFFCSLGWSVIGNVYSVGDR